MSCSLPSCLFPSNFHFCRVLFAGSRHMWCNYNTRWREDLTVLSVCRGHAAALSQRTHGLLTEQESWIKASVLSEVIVIKISNYRVKMTFWENEGITNTEKKPSWHLQRECSPPQVLQLFRSSSVYAVWALQICSLSHNTCGWLHPLWPWLVSACYKCAGRTHLRWSLWERKGGRNKSETKLWARGKKKEASRSLHDGK